MRPKMKFRSAMKKPLFAFFSIENEVKRNFVSGVFSAKRLLVLQILNYCQKITKIEKIMLIYEYFL